MPLLDLNPSPVTKVLRKVESILKVDPTLKRTVKTWRTWREKPGQNAPFGSDLPLPAVRITPINGPQFWKFPDAFVGDLYLRFEMLLQGCDVDDPLNLWWAMETALYPGGAQTLTNITALQQAGAYSGLAEFSLPAYDDSPDGNFWLATGQMKIAVLLTIKY
jgi:hypothetical protein